MKRKGQNSFRRGAGMLVATAGLAAGLAACGGSSSSASSQAPASPSSTPPPASTAAQSDSNAAAGGVASPGTKLAIGSSATVDYRPLSGSHAPSKLKVTVESLQKGTLDDFKGIELDSAQKASTPIYVKVKVTNLGPGTIDVDGTSAAIEGLDGTGNTAQSVTFIGTFPKCPDHQSTSQMPSGSSYDSCLTFLVPGGISKVAYTGTDAYINSPVTWAAG